MEEAVLSIKDLFYLGTLIVGIIGGFFTIKASTSIQDKRLVILEEEVKNIKEMKTQVAVIEQRVIDIDERLKGKNG